MRRSFRDALAEAREWEVRVAHWARTRGWHVLPTYDFSGGDGDDKAPKLMAPPGQPDLVMPDLQCFRARKIRWLEVKLKTHADLHRKTQTRVTGISRRLLDHYRLVEERTGGEVFVVFLHKKEREVRGAPLSTLLKSIHHEYKGTKMGRAGMVFWNYDDLPNWGGLDAVFGGVDGEAQQ